jgi:hypothetical protein
MSLQEMDKFTEIMDQLENKVLGPRAASWLQDVTDPAFGLVNSVIDTFHEHLDTKAEATRFLRLLRQLCTHSAEYVLPQICDSLKFIQDITLFVIGASPEASEDAFSLIVKVHNTGMTLLVGQEFIEAVFDSFEYLQNEGTYRDLVSMLVDMSNSTQEGQLNLVLEVSAAHKNRRYFGEVLLLLLNRSRGPFLLSVLRVVKELLVFPKTQHGFFYSNDLEALGDIVINAIEDTGEPEVQLKFLEFLDTLFKCEDYLDLEYRVGDFYNLLKARSDDDSNLLVQSAARQALTYLVLS